MRKSVVLYATFFLILSIFFSRIVLINPTIQIIGDGGDNYEYFGYMHLANQNISLFKHPFSYTNTFRYPNGFDFSYGHDGTFVVLLGALLSFFISLPLTYNLVVIGILWINLFVIFIIIQKILKRLIPTCQNINLIAFIGALLDGWSPYVFAHLNGQLNLTLTAGFPLFIYSLFNVYLHIKDNRRIKLTDLLYVSGSVFLISMASIQYVLITGQVIVVLFFISFFISSFKKGLSNAIQSFFGFIKDNIRNLTIALFFLVVPFLYFHGGYIKAIVSKGLTLSKVVVYSPNATKPAITDMFVPNSYLGSWWTNLNPSAETIEKVIGFGIVGWIIILGYFLYEKSRKYKVIMTMSIGVLFVAIYFIKPFLVPEAARIWPLLSFPIIILLVFRLSSLSKRYLLLIIIVLLFERGAFYIRIRPPFPHNVANIVKKQSGAVLHVPLVSNQGYHSALSYFWGKPIVDGYFLHIADTQSANAFLLDKDMAIFDCNKSSADLLNRFEPNSFIQKLKDNGIFTIALIKKGQNGDLWHSPECVYVRRAWDMLLPGRIKQNGDEVIEHKFTIDPADVVNKRIYADKDGILRLERLSIWPKSIDDVVLSTPGGTIVPDWKGAKIVNNDLLVDYFPRIFFPLREGQYIELISTKSSEKTEIYPMIYYYFDTNVKLSSNHIYNSRNAYPYYLNLLWMDENMEVYSVK